MSKPSWAEKLLVYHRGVGTVEKRGYYVVPKIEEMITRRAQVLSSNLTPSVTFRGRPCPSPTCFYYADSPQAIAARVVTPLASRLERTRHVAMRGYSAMREGATRLGLLDRDDSAAARSTLAPGSARTGAPAGASSTSGATRGVGSSGDGNGECSPASRQLGQTLQVCSIGPPTPGVGHHASQALRTSAFRGRASTHRASNRLAFASLACGQNVEIRLSSLFEETILSAPTHRHVLLAFRHTDATQVRRPPRVSRPSLNVATRRKLSLTFADVR